MFAGFRVSGYRSLDRFTLPLKMGINALVGPNGVGKTNTLEAISFAAAVMSSSLDSAISQHGGIGSVFARSSDGDFRQSMRFSVDGFVAMSGGRRTGSVTAFLAYDYRFSIGLTAELKPYIHKQQLEITDITDILEGEDEVDDSGHCALFIKEYKRNKFRVSAFDKDRLGPMPTRISGSKNPRSSLADRLEERVWGGESLLEALSPLLFAVHRIRTSVSRLRLLSVVPSKVRAGDDIGNAPEIKPDGSGLPTVLNSLQNGSFPGFSRQKCLDTLGHIQDLLCLAVPSVSSVESVVDRPMGRVRMAFYQSRDGSESKVPVLASDGTIKWLVLVTSMLTKHDFLVEEPENYLHPWMQREYVKLMRSERRPYPGFIFSTHSETVLNALDPSEVIIMNHDGVKSTAKRVSSQKKLKQAIEETGFGLGFYYLSGGLD